MAKADHNKLNKPSRARLIPVLSDSKKEERATSIFLAALMYIPAFAQELFSPIGQRVGKRTKIECFTEVDLINKPNKTKERPDGLIMFSIGNKEWSALVESKIENATIDSGQIESYIRLAKANGINCLISISNQFASRSDHLPYHLSGTVSQNFSVHHWSWQHIKTIAFLVANNPKLELDIEQRLILVEMFDYFSHSSSGVRAIKRMNSEWKDLVRSAVARNLLNPKSDKVVNSVKRWHEEQKDLCLRLSRHIGAMVNLRLTKAHEADPLKRIEEDARDLVNQKELVAELEIPNAASHLYVTANISSRGINCRMKISAPGDKQRFSSRINWLLRQLPKDLPNNTDLTLFWPGRIKPTSAPINSVKEDPHIVQADNKKLLPHAMQVSMWHDAAGSFSGAKTFVVSLEKLVETFYDSVGQHLKNWQPHPPKPLEEMKSSVPKEIMGPAQAKVLDAGTLKTIFDDGD